MQKATHYSYSQSCWIVFYPYAIITALWIPLTLFVELYIKDVLIVTLIVDLIATSIVFIQSYRYNNTSIYDFYWQIPGFYLIIYWVFRTPYQPNIWLIIVPFAYFIRHNYNFLSFWPGLTYEDFRYPVFRKKLNNEFIYWIFSYFGLHIGPTLMVYFGLYPTYYALFDSDQEYNEYVFYFGVLFAFSALTIETIADLQLFPWRSKKTQEFIDEGLWKYSRHPNYFGECMFWWGLFIMTLSFGYQYWFTIIGAVIMQSLFLFYSIPEMEKHILRKRPKYYIQQKRVSVFIPWFRNENVK
ncbi:unnamed protein product [Paramecium primaurelia]|uniref:Steroid 5-alpha reductase C-terminal domain-containing protein n=1 Tax=Paramecium primaurelia TaxID=5886 RepID=A0A8S1L1M5_PARPR|nr:unnamed protein product [Paramecium primaurelia]